jgi:hypothetical protein
VTVAPANSARATAAAANTDTVIAVRDLRKSYAPLAVDGLVLAGRLASDA